jgi:hypothetical protein
MQQVSMDAVSGNQLCVVCQGISLDSLAGSGGYRHVTTDSELRLSAATCALCKMIKGCLMDNPEIQEEDEASAVARNPEAGFTCSIRHCGIKPSFG